MTAPLKIIVEEFPHCKIVRFGSEEQLLHLFVTRGEEKFALEVERSDSIGTVKQKIQHAKGISSDHMILSLADERHPPFADARTLLECGLSNGSTLRLQFDVFQILIERQTGKKFPLVVKPSDLVLEVQQKISDALSIPIDEQRFYFGNSTTSCLPEVTLSHYGTDVGSIFYLYPPQLGGGKGMFHFVSTLTLFTTRLVQII